MFKSKKVVWLITIFFILSLALAGCSKKGEDTSPIKIGVIGPQSGPSAEGGQSVAKGAQLAVDRINAAGGINGRKIELVIADGKNDPTESLNAANKLIMQDKVVAIMGAMGSSATLAIMPAMEKNQVPLLVETSSASKITEQGNKYVFRISATTRQEAEGVEDLIVTKIGFKNVALLGVNNDWGRGAATEFTNVVEKHGGLVVATEYFEGDAVDFYPQLTKIKSSGADSVILTCDASLIVLVVRQMNDLGIDLPVLTTGGSDFTDGVIELAGKEAAEGLRSIAFFNPGIPEVAPDQESHKAFVENWKKNNYTWRRILDGARGYDGIAVLAEAMKGIEGEINSASLQEALKKVDYAGITGKLKFNEKGQAKRNIFLVKVVDGVTVIDN